MKENSNSIFLQESYNLRGYKINIDFYINNF